ncbi:MAG: hypothetical protein RLZZ15_2257, partial [Verrucomicrobiota bacterium]
MPRHPPVFTPATTRAFLTVALLATA